MSSSSIVELALLNYLQNVYSSNMKLPYNRLKPCGRVLFAAKGGKIHSFSLHDGSHISTWKHPDVERLVEAQAQSQPEAESNLSAVAATLTSAQEEDYEESDDNNGPPAKRQRLTDDLEPGQSKDDDNTVMDMDEPASGDESKETGPKSRRQKKRARRDRKTGPNLRHGYGKVPDQPIITQMAVTSTGSHLLATSGHDKTIWVFEHDGNGTLTQLSQRPMPKRPNAVLISVDNKTILCGDKFGDVYTLPLLASLDGSTENTLSSRSTPAPSANKAWKPEATNFTVHSQRNLKALEQQRLWAAKADQEAREGIHSDRPTFEHNLVIGHVSLLTAMCLAQSEGRRYIITADRDEHIRVSRYMPQTHVIEGFCLGHKHFVTGLAIPPARPDLLISGGGDDELFVWDWERGRLLGKFDLLGRAKRVAPRASKIAVSHVSSTTVQYDGKETPFVFAICEDVPYIFVLRIADDSSLVHVQTYLCPGTPLDLTHVYTEQGALSKLLVALDITGMVTTTPRIMSLVWRQGSFGVDILFEVEDSGLYADEADVSEDDVRALLYNVEDLRKQSLDSNGDERGAEEEQGMAPSVGTEADRPGHE
ncbi:hypothetical protein SODALDRAFT_334394 [Sodiomyces alkalinus F11]|uniref:Transfer RNA methyltransferase 82 n=1 Tax=Sodiomyces alkalinus (strain CBS 110278 / VKM F-3762 / F11) TaxID=1314773 RepID=A0A3N2PS56_SODAK|nr:hypothetical protein SODALDRAFT_334394 [Sodiomyces alkalinus F11]ROT37300.1 hypothetical protein SODALDRAFT_334394 [Sodiomyces alkalinus F11]